MTVTDFIALLQIERVGVDGKIVEVLRVVKRYLFNQLVGAFREVGCSHFLLICNVVSEITVV